MKNIFVLAVTRLSTGVCVAGITEDGRWIRPTRPKGTNWRQLEYADCKDKSGKWIVRKGNVVAFDLIKAIPLGAHSEDWLVGCQRPQLIEESCEEDRRDICQQIEDSAVAVDSQDSTRSLFMVHPSQVASFAFKFETDLKGKTKYVPRCSFCMGRRTYQGIGVSDLEWRGYGRQLIKERGYELSMTGKQVFTAIDVSDCWLAVGRNEVRGTPYLLVVGVHLFPPRSYEMDFQR